MANQITLPVKAGLRLTKNLNFCGKKNAQKLPKRFQMLLRLVTASENAEYIYGKRRYVKLIAVCVSFPNA